MLHGFQFLLLGGNGKHLLAVILLVGNVRQAPVFEPGDSFNTWLLLQPASLVFPGSLRRAMAK